MSRRFSKHNITGSEAHQARPIAYMRKGFVARRQRPRPRPLWTLSLLGLAVAVTLTWLFR